MKYKKLLLIITIVTLYCSSIYAKENNYDLSINKTVGTYKEYINDPNHLVSHKTLNVKKDVVVVYQLLYTNNSASTTTPVDTVLYDIYDSDKLTIIGLGNKCTNNPNYLTNPNRGLITCDAKDLIPGDSFRYYYKAAIKNTASGTIYNTVEIIPDNDVNPNNNGTNGLNRTPRDFDINDINDRSSAQLTLLEDPINGECGTASKAYPYGTTQYPRNTTYCTSGIPNPYPPTFPINGNLVTWICEGVNGGSNDTTCAARLLSTHTPN